jgi:hypothetical protein
LPLVAQVIEFTQSPLTPFLGNWVRDPASVSRNKVAKRVLGEEGFKKLWACGSIEELRECLDADPALSEKYQAVDRMSHGLTGTRMEISPQAIVWKNSGEVGDSTETRLFTVLRVTAEGRKVIVQTVDTSRGNRGKPAAYVFRMNKRWLIASERYQGANARLFPPSPTFRYYRHP